MTATTLPNQVFDVKHLDLLCVSTNLDNKWSNTRSKQEQSHFSDYNPIIIHINPLYLSTATAKGPGDFHPR